MARSSHYYDRIVQRHHSVYRRKFWEEEKKKAQKVQDVLGTITGEKLTKLIQSLWPSLKKISGTRDWAASFKLTGGKK